MADSEDESQRKAFPSFEADDSSLEGTRVDLGDDLIEKTALIPGLLPKKDEFAPQSEEPSFPTTPAEIEDLLQSGIILFNEGIIEEAKKVFRRIILADPSHPLARAKLEEIHELELKQIIEGSPRRRRKSLRAREEEVLFVNSDEVMRQLDRDLKLGVFEDGDGGESVAAELSIFQTKEAVDAFGDKLEKQMLSASAKDRIDVGIAFTEMGLYDLAAKQFRAASHDLTMSLTASSLLAYSLVLAGRPFEAILAVEPLLGDVELVEDDRMELLYLMGRAYEGLKNQEAALQWYQQVYQLNPHYRDTASRMRVIVESGKTKARDERG